MVATAPIPPEALLPHRRVCNRLALEPGAFARRHALDAIDWRTWSISVLAEAASTGRPLLVLTGDSSCAACNDLGRTALADRALARMINRRFVPVLVDRAERPDVDAWLMLAVQVLTGGAGWPAVVILSPDARPVAAESWGAAGVGTRPLAQLVTDVARRLDLGGGAIEERAEATFEKMARRATLETDGPLPDAAAVSAALRAHAATTFDAAAGTFGPPPLFPRAPLVDFLVARGTRGDAAALEMAARALESLQAGALADRERGGFFRFARGAAWGDPVPEKYLADNAALARTFLEAGVATGRADFLQTATRTMEFVQRDLALPNGSFAASLDASVSPAVRDEATLADANAIAIATFVRAAAVLREPRWLDAAVAAARDVDVRLRDGARVAHCARGGRRCSGSGELADHALLALAYVDLDEASARGEGRWLAAAREIADALPARFGHEAAGGFFQAANDAEPLPLRLKPALDTIVPSGNSSAALLFFRLAERQPQRRDVARGTFEAFSETLTLRPHALPAMVSALERFARDQSAASASAPPQLDPAPAVQP